MNRAAELIANCSIELSPRDEYAGEALCNLLDPGITVFVNYAPSVTHHDIVAACVRLHRAGYVAVPHVAARRLAFLRCAILDCAIVSACSCTRRFLLQRSS